MNWITFGFAGKANLTSHGIKNPATLSEQIAAQRVNTQIKNLVEAICWTEILVVVYSTNEKGNDSAPYDTGSCANTAETIVIPQTLPSESSFESSFERLESS